PAPWALAIANGCAMSAPARPALRLTKRRRVMLALDLRALRCEPGFITILPEWAWIAQAQPRAQYHRPGQPLSRRPIDQPSPLTLLHARALMSPLSLQSATNVHGNERGRLRGRATRPRRCAQRRRQSASPSRALAQAPTVARSRCARGPFGLLRATPAGVGVPRLRALAGEPRHPPGAIRCAGRDRGQFGLVTGRGCGAAGHRARAPRAPVGWA